MNPIVGKVLTFFILIGVGFTIKKVRLVDDSFTKGLSTFVLYVTLPALVIDSMQFQFSFEMLSSSLILFLSGGFLYTFLWIVGLVVVRLLKLEGKARAVVLYASLLGNVAYMGYPVVEMLLGKEGLFYTGVFNIWFNVLTWTAGVRIIAGGEFGKRKKCLLNPGIISLLIGLFLFVFSIPLPSFLDESLSMLGECTVPLAMVIAGITLAGAKMKSVLGDQRVIVLQPLQTSCSSSDCLFLPAIGRTARCRRENPYNYERHAGGSQYFHIRQNIRFRLRSSIEVDRVFDLFLAGEYSRNNLVI